MIVEIAQFRTKDGVKDEELLEKSRQVYDNFLSKCKGLVSRELLKNEDGTWMDIVHFETLDDAKNAADDFSKSPYGKDFESVLDVSTAKMLHFKVAEKY